MSRILVIEDDAGLRELINLSLHKQFEVLEAANGRDGILMAHQLRPDLILCDISMPEMDGYRVLELLRQDASTASIPFIFVTAFVDRADVRRGMDLGADDYLTKPFTSVELREMVNGCLRKKVRQEQELKRAVEELHQNIMHSLPHELRTAIMVIEGYVHLMLEEAQEVSPRHQEMLHAVGNANRRLHRLAEKFLWYSKIQLMDTVNLRTQITDKADDAVLWMATEKAHQVERYGDLQMEIENAVLCVPPECVQKIVEEVVENAFKFSAEGTPVIVRAAVKNGAYTITVTDQGRGISESQIAKIQAFTQFERSIYEQQGLGLGLIIAKRLTELFGGTFQIDSVPGQMTEVTITLPHLAGVSGHPEQNSGTRMMSGTLPV